MNRRPPHFADAIFVSTLCLFAFGTVTVLAMGPDAMPAWLRTTLLILGKLTWVVIPLGYFFAVGADVREACYLRWPKGRDLVLVLPIWLSSVWLLLGALVGMEWLSEKLGLHFEDRAEAVQEQLDRLLLLGPVASALLLGPVTALQEEFLFRGAVISGFARSFHPMRALVYTSLIFGLMHGFDLYLPRVVITTLLGFLFGYAVLSTGSIVPAILLHTMNNLAALALLEGLVEAPPWMTIPPAAVVLVLSLVLLGRPNER